MTAKTPEDYLSMSDDDFMNLPDLATGVEETPEAPSEEGTEVTPDTTEIPTEVPQQTQEELPTPVDASTEGDETIPEDAPEANPEDQSSQADPSSLVPAEGKKAPEQGSEEAKKSEEAPDYKALYEAMLQPIKANGRTIEIKSPEEAIRLMQMGAGFGRKMHDIQPHLKTLRFLEQNQLLNVDQTELAFLVDLRNKNPDAIKKLIKEAGIDPLDLNMDEEVKYQSKAIPVTDQQVILEERLSTLASQDGGIETLQVARDTWDRQSQDAVAAQPEILEHIHTQRMTGVYDVIVNEMERQKALGAIPYGTPFLQAYHQVGQYLQENNGFSHLQGNRTQTAVQQPAGLATQQKQPQLLDTKVAAPKPQVSNSDLAKAAAPSRASSRRSAPVINPLAMSDEEFEKQFGKNF